MLDAMILLTHLLAGHASVLAKLFSSKLKNPEGFMKEQGKKVDGLC